MTLGDGIRYNIATLPFDEKVAFRDAVIKLHLKIHYPDEVSGWFKQDQIHQKTHVHGGSGFLPWHRELCNRFEQLLRQVEPGISLHYWDFTQHPEMINLLGPTGLFGASHGMVGPPLDVLHNKGIETGSRGRRDPRDSSAPPQDPTLPPLVIERDLDTIFRFADSDEVIVSTGDEFEGTAVLPQYHWKLFRRGLERAHNSAHNFIRGNIGTDHFAFEDPFVFLLHSNVDRLWASWQVQPGKAWRFDPDKIYGVESDDPRITEFMEPWAGGNIRPEQKMRPWGIDWPAEEKNARDDSIVRKIPKYDRYTNLG